MRCQRCWFIVLCPIFAFGFGDRAVLSQTIPDRTLGSESSIVKPNATVKGQTGTLIEGGAVRDSNLFHSFDEFNVGNGEAVYFASPNDTANIFSRVTGNNSSQIFGTLGVQGTANLFLLNPNGIVFGENAALDINGSFFATTADSYVFDNDFSHSASNPEVPPLLTVNLPVGVQFGEQAEPIVNRSTMISEFGFPGGLRVNAGNNISLIGGDILFEEGSITVESGRIELGSVAPQSLVTITPLENSWSLDYDGINTWQNIQFSQGSSLDVSGNGSGWIQLKGKQIRLLDGSDIYAINFGDGDSKNIAISATELVELSGGEQQGQLLSLIQSAAIGEGKGGDIEIEANVLRLANGGQIGTGTSGGGDSGDLSIRAEEIEIAGVSQDGFPSGLFTSVGDFAPDPAVATGTGGNLNIKTNNLHLANRGIIGAGTFGFGNSGDIQIEAQQIVVDSAQISSSTFTQGNSGNIIIDAQQLKVIGEAGQIGTSNFGSGQAGNLIVKASDSVEIEGFGLLPSFETGELGIFSSGLFASVELGATGNGGELIVETNRLAISEGGKIVANTLGRGDAGDITIRANSVKVEDVIVDTFGGKSGINSNVEISGTGNGGDLSIYSNSLEVSNGGAISVDAKGKGNAGSVYLEASDINVSGRSEPIVINEIEHPSLASEISAFAQGEFNAGSVTINTERLNVAEDAKISVNNIGQGNSGNLNITANNIFLDRSAALTAEVNGGEQGNIHLTTDNLFLNDRSIISATARGESIGGNIKIDSAENLVVNNNSAIIANADLGDGGEIDIVTQGYFISSNSSISASSQFGLDGDVEIKTINGDRSIELEQLPVQLEDASQRIVKTCGIGDNQFALVGKGGLAENPSQNLRGHAVWKDLRIPVIWSNAATSKLPTSRSPEADVSGSGSVEANSWRVTSQGKIQLLARQNHQSGWQFHHLQCQSSNPSHHGFSRVLGN